MRFVVLLAALGAWALVGCSAHNYHPDPKVPAGANRSSCKAAYDHLVALGCEDEAATGGGFADFCLEMAEDNRVNMHPACVLTIDTCDAFKAATKGKGAKCS